MKKRNLRVAERVVHRFYALQVERLGAEIEESFMKAMSSGGPEEIEQRMGEHYRKTKVQRYQLAFFRQIAIISEATRAGIDIPNDYWADPIPEWDRRHLTERGETHLIRAVRLQKIATTKDWVAVIMPVLSSIIAILSLLLAFRKHQFRLCLCEES